jgi:hypothetical protein
MKITNINQLTSEIANREQGKSEVAIGNVREVVRILVDLQAEHINQSKDATEGRSPLAFLMEMAIEKAKKSNG